VQVCPIGARAARGREPRNREPRTRDVASSPDDKTAKPPTGADDPRRPADDIVPPEVEVDPDEDAEEEINPADLGHMVRFLLPYLRPYRGQTILLGVLLLIQTAFNFSFPLMMQYLIDEGLINRDWSALTVVLTFLAFAAVGVSIVSIGVDFVYSRLFANVVKDMRQSLYDHVQSLSMPFFQRTPSGQVLSRFSGDLVSVESVLVALVPLFIMPVLEVIYSTALMFIFNVWLGLLGLLAFPVILFGPRIFAKKAFGISYEKRLREAQLLSTSGETVAAQPVVKAFGLAPRLRSSYADLNQRWYGYAFKVNFFSALVESTAYMGIYVVHILIFALGAYWAYTGEITIGTLVAFEGMFVSMGYALTNVMQFVPSLAQAAGSMRHLDEMFQEKPDFVDAPGAIALPRLNEGISFEGVSFGYVPKKLALRQTNLTIPKGSYVAVVGPSGSGKSTILNLVMRFYDPTAGKLRFDGIDITSVTQASLREQIGIVFQESFLFNASILANVRMGKQDATEDDVIEALKAAEVWDFVQTLPDGLSTLVGERGGTLSGGQRQRVAIARALVRDPAILVLDEATSALDAIAESAINATIKKIAATRTVISVTHRLQNTVDADLVVVLDHGNIREFGSYRELSTKPDGFFASLLKRQQRVGKGG
jgi:ATP-binding cassette, subfamily B, bacterial